MKFSIRHSLRWSIFISFFDILGLAAAAANEILFHAMASKKVNGLRQAIFILRNADRFSNFCNDVIGDISDVISGAAAALVVMKLMSGLPEGSKALRTAISVVFTAIVSALTVSGKAMGKSFAIHYSNRHRVIYRQAVLLCRASARHEAFFRQKKKIKPWKAREQACCSNKYASLRI